MRQKMTQTSKLWLRLRHLASVARIGPGPGGRKSSLGSSFRSPSSPPRMNRRLVSCPDERWTPVTFPFMSSTRQDADGMERGSGVWKSDISRAVVKTCKRWSHPCSPMGCFVLHDTHEFLTCSIAWLLCCVASMAIFDVICSVSQVWSPDAVILRHPNVFPCGWSAQPQQPAHGASQGDTMVPSMKWIHLHCCRELPALGLGRRHDFFASTSGVPLDCCSGTTFLRFTVSQKQ